MEIHCDNCSYEGKGYVDKYNYVFFILSTLVLGGFLFALTFARRPLFSSRRGGSGIGLYGLVAAYLGYFFRPQKYHCPQCKGKWGTPLAFHRVLNPEDSFPKL